MASFRETLARLFSRKIIVKKAVSGQIKTVDYEKAQSMGNRKSAYGRYKWKDTKARFSGYGYGTGEVNNVNRNTLYIDYENMDRDSYLSSALDIYADESCSKNQYGEVLVIKTTREDVKKVLYNLFYDIMNVEFNLWSWIRSMCKYGDFFLYLDIKENFGIVDVIPIHPLYVERQEEMVDQNSITSESKVRFIYTGEGGHFNRNVLQEFEIAHFRLLSDPNYLPYGKSIFEGARNSFKQLLLMEDAMLLHRIMRAPERRVVKIDVGTIPPEEVDQHVEEVVNTLKKVPYVDEMTGEYNLKFNLTNMMEDIYIPVRGGESGTSIDTLPGLNNEGQIEDIEYIRDKMLSHLKISKNYLGLGEQGEAKANLASEDIRFAKTIERVQKIFISELYKVAIIHLLAQGFDKEILADFELELTNPSVLLRRQNVDLMNEQMTLISNIKESKLLSDKFIYENILGLTEDQWKKEQMLVVEDLKRQFRYEQITSEGNDPAVTGESFGTPHDLATAASANPELRKNLKDVFKQDGRSENPGRPKEPGTFERHKDPTWGRDPLGKKIGDSMIKNDWVNKSDSLRKTLLESFQEEKDKEYLSIFDENEMLKDI